MACLQFVRTENVLAYLWELRARLRVGLNHATAQAEIPFECGGLDPMNLADAPVSQTTSVSLQAAAGRVRAVGAGQALLWEYFPQVMAVRGVLLRRGGLNFLTDSHTPAQIDEVIRVAAETSAQLRNL